MRKKSIFLLFFVLVTFLSIGQTEFSEIVLTDNIIQGIDTWVDDLNMDGHQDIITATRTGGGEISWWRNNGSSGFIKNTVDNNVNWVRSVRSGDLSGDDIPDLVAAILGTNTVKWYKNVANGLFISEVVDDDMIGAHTVDIKDVNGDGMNDILCSGFDNSSAFSEIVWYKNTEDNGFEKHVISTRFQQSPFIYGEDMDNDNDIDIVACGEINDEIYWWENIGDDDNFIEHYVDDDINAIHTVIARDVDMDGDMDILGAACMGSRLAWYENDGSQYFTKHDLGYYAGALWLDAVDLDNDGDNDLVSTGMGESRLSWWENNNMEFTEHYFETTFYQGFCLTPANIDNDADIDIIAAGFETNKISIFENMHDKSKIFRNPESVEYDYVNNRYLVSNWGNGNIVQINDDGDTSYFSTELDHIAGLHIKQPFLYAASNDGPNQGLAIFHLATDNLVAVIEIEGLGMLNDITSDNNGNLYLTDMDANKIYKFCEETHEYYTYVEEGIQTPNGIFFDTENNRLLVNNGGAFGFPIVQVTLADSTVSVLAETGVSAIDGITMDDEGYVYYSAWSTNSVYRFDPSFSQPPVVISNNHSGPADMFYRSDTEELVIPNFNSGQIDFVNISTIGMKDFIRPGKTKLNVSPNPASNSVQIMPGNDINYKKLLIYNSLGKMVFSRSLLPPGGSQQYLWDLKNDKGDKVSPGLYFIQVVSDYEKLTQKIIVY